MQDSAPPAQAGSEKAAAVSRRRPAGILLYGMYDLSRLDSAPRVRISMMTDALSVQTHTERISGGRLARAAAALRWLAGGGAHRVGVVYVESATSSAMPTDLAFLGVMRLLRRPVGVYFRDAYQLFRDVHPRVSRRQILSDLLWRITTPLLKLVAQVRYAPSNGLAAALRLRNPVILPPGTDPGAPDLGIGDDDLVGAIVQIAPRSGLDRLIAAMDLVRAQRPAARLRIVTRSFDARTAAAMPPWMEMVPGTRSAIADALAGARVCVLPLPINAYTNLAVAVRLLDLLAFGKPVVATDTFETRAILEASGAGVVTGESAAEMAAGILELLGDRARAERCAAAARAYALYPVNTWAARATTVLRTLGVKGEADR
jgi:glycosyltransferase involved in cell wall biosynthesis